MNAPKVDQSTRPRRRAANPSAPAQPGAGVAGETQQAAGVRTETGSLRLVNPSGSEPAAVEAPPVAAVDSPLARPVPQPLPPLEPKVDYRTHTVKDGDKLWLLAEKYLGKGHRFKQIIELNEALRENPDSLKPGMVLRIPPKK